MGYLSIPNLYKSQDILLFKECFALEKIHGSSASCSYSNGCVKFFSGGEKHESFVKLFNQEFLLEKFKEIGQPDIVCNGEVYGGKCQGMSVIYGKELKFIAFDVRIGDCWLDVPKAESIVKSLGLEFVHYVKISTDLKEIDAQRDMYSIQAIRNGISEYAGPNANVLNPKMREGIVLRPLIELTKNNGERIICKHKRAEFIETKTPRVVDLDKQRVLESAQLIVDEWVTNNRLNNILSHLKDEEKQIENMGGIIRIMIEDVKREGENEIVWSKDLEKLIGRQTAILFKNKM